MNPGPSVTTTPIQQLLTGGENSGYVQTVSLYTNPNGDSSAASANTILVNNALTSGGIVNLTGNGVAYINAPLVLQSNTRLVCQPTLTLRQAPGTSKNMIRTQTMADYVFNNTTVTITWVSGLDFTVNWTGHGKTAGQAILLYGATGALAFNGVFRIHTVTDVNSFVCKLRNLPAASPGGTIKAISAVQNVVIDGLALDYDTTNNSGASDYNRHSVYLYGVCDIELRNMRSSNATKYAYCVQAGLSVRGVNIAVPWNNSDGLKLYGPLHDVNIAGLAGRCGDDCFSVQAKEAAAFSTSPFDFAGGDATAVTVKDASLSSTNGTVGCGKVYLSDLEYTDKIVFENITGTTPGPTAVVELGAAYTTGFCGKLTFREIGGSGSYSFRHTSGTVDQIVLEGIKANPLSTTGQIVLQDSVAICRQMVIMNSEIGALNWPSAAVSAVQPAGTIEQLTFQNVIARTLGAGQTRMLALIAGALVREVNFIACKSDGDNVVTVAASVTNVPSINMHGCEFTGAAVVGVSSSCDISLTGGNRFNNASNGVVRFNATATVNLKSDGTTKLVAGSWVAAPAGTPTLRCYGFDIAIDVGAAIGFDKTVSGQYLFNNGAARGTLVQNRLVSVNGTNVIQLDTPANTF